MDSNVNFFTRDRTNPPEVLGSVEHRYDNAEHDIGEDKEFYFAKLKSPHVCEKFSLRKNILARLFFKKHRETEDNSFNRNIKRAGGHPYHGSSANINEFYRVLRHPEATDASRVNDRLRTFVVIEVHKGCQIINNWRCGDLVHYVNRIAHEYSIHPGITVQNVNNSSTTPVIVRAQPPCEAYGKSFACEQRNDAAPTQHNPNTMEIHHHYYQCCCGYQKNCRNPKTRDTRYAGQLTYRDLRQVFTEGNPVPSIEIRRHCIILCLPPLSCVVMADRVFFLVVEEMSIDKLLFGIQQLQKKHMMFGNLESLAASRSLSPQGGVTDGGEGFSDITAVKNNNVLNKTFVTTKQACTQVQAYKKTEFIRSTSHISQGENGVSDCGKALVTAELDHQSSNINNLTDSNFSQLSPMEFETLELLFSASFSQLTSDIDQLELLLQDIVAKATYDSPTKHGGENLHALKSYTRMYGNRVYLYDKALDSLMSNADELVQMELTRLKNECQPKTFTYPYCEEGMGYNPEPNPDLEILLEYFDQEIEQLRQRVSRVMEGIESVERLVSLNLALSHNRLLRWDVGSGMVAVVLGLSALISGILGMNVKIPMENMNYAFEIITSSICCITIIGMILIYVVIRMTRL